MVLTRKVYFWFIGKIALQTILFLIFLKYFGIKSLQRYHAQKVVISSWKEFSGYIPAPAVTICPRVPKEDEPFRFTDPKDPIGSWCGNRSENETFPCLQDIFSNLTSTIRTVSDEYMFGNLDLNQEEWTPDFTASANGICFTLNRSQNMALKDHILIHFLSNSSYVFVHDPHFFVLNWNPELAINNFLFEGNFARVMKIITVQHKKINLASSPCNPDPSYSFTACIKQVLHWLSLHHLHHLHCITGCIKQALHCLSLYYWLYHCITGWTTVSLAVSLHPWLYQWLYHWLYHCIPGFITVSLTVSQYHWLYQAGPLPRSWL